MILSQFYNSKITVCTRKHPAYLKEQLFVRSDSWWSVPGYNFPALSIIYLVAVKPDMKVLTDEKSLFGPSVIKISNRGNLLNSGKLSFLQNIRPYVHHSGTF